MPSTLSSAAAALLVGSASAAQYWVNDYDAYLNGDYGTTPNVTFKSTDLVQPLFQLSADPANSSLAGGYFTMATAIGDQDTAVMIFRGDDMSLVYALPRTAGTGDVNIQELDGSFVLTYFGTFLGSNTADEGYIYSNEYEYMYTTNTVDLSVASDGHEQLITADGTVIMTAYMPRDWDLTDAGGEEDGTLLDSCFEEVDFKTNTSIFSWCASDHFDPSLSLASAGGNGGGGGGGGGGPPPGFGDNSTSSSVPTASGTAAPSTAMNAFSSTVSSGAKLNVPHDEDLVPLKLKSSGQQSQAQNDGLVARQMPGNGAFDAYHINSIDKTKDGNYLVSLRLLALAVLIDGTTGEPIWHLGDVLNDFEDLSGGNATNFSYQHHIRFHNDETELTIFDNHDADQSRGLHLKLDQDAMTVEVITEAYHPAAVYAAAMGSEVLLPNTDLFTGYGAQPTFTVHNTAGECLLEGWWHSSAGGGMASNYRYFWVPAENWIAQPTTSPDVAVEDATVYVSWNGATEVASWVVYNRNDESVATAARDGFETAIDIPGVSGDVYVEALDASGKVLGTSATATATATAKRSVAFRG